jgi:hypothetical protein
VGICVWVCGVWVCECVGISVGLGLGVGVCVWGVGVWVCGCLGVWVCGCLGVWLCGWVGGWMCLCLCHFCSLKIDQVMHETGAMLKTFSRASFA